MGTYHLRALDATRGLTRVFVYIAWSIIDWFVAPAAMDKLKRLHPRIRALSLLAFHAREKFLSHLFSERKKKILFSREQDLEKNIKAGFYDSPHEIAFEDSPPPATSRITILSCR
jgi:hypothetical protein